MDDSVIYSHQGVTVGYGYFTVNGNTYSFEGITSVRLQMLRPKRIFPRLMVYGGLPFIFGRGLFLFFGIILILSGLLTGRSAKMQYALVVQTNAGDYQPYISENFQDIADAVSALNIALAMKG